MSKVVYEFHVKKYTVLKLDELPNNPYRSFLIRGKTYKSIPILDAENCIAIESNESFIGETVDFLD